MKLLHAQTIDSTLIRETIETPRGDLINPFTGELPSGVGDGPLNEIIRMDHYDGMEVLEIQDAATDMDELETNGKKYRIIESKRSQQYGFWDWIKCERYLINGI